MLNLLFVGNMCCVSAIAIENNYFHDLIRV